MSEKTSCDASENPRKEPGDVARDSAEVPVVSDEPVEVPVVSDEPVEVPVVSDEPIEVMDHAEESVDVDEEEPNDVEDAEEYTVDDSSHEADGCPDPTPAEIRAWLNHETSLIRAVHDLWKICAEFGIADNGVVDKNLRSPFFEIHGTRRRSRRDFEEMLLTSIREVHKLLLPDKNHPAWDPILALLKTPVSFWLLWRLENARLRSEALVCELKALRAFIADSLNPFFYDDDEESGEESHSDESDTDANDDLDDFQMAAVRFDRLLEVFEKTTVEMHIDVKALIVRLPASMENRKFNPIRETAMSDSLAMIFLAYANAKNPGNQEESDDDLDDDELKIDEEVRLANIELSVHDGLNGEIDEAADSALAEFRRKRREQLKGRFHYYAGVESYMKPLKERPKPKVRRITTLPVRKFDGDTKNVRKRPLDKKS